MLARPDATPADQRSALAMSTIAFTVCFAVWTIFSIIGIRIKQELGLNETQFGLLVGTPILTGSLIRLALGIWTDQYGGRLVYTLVMLRRRSATFLLSWAHTYPQMSCSPRSGVGIAGGSFAVGVAYVSRWYPTEKQGTALGIFGAGNVGAAVTKFVAPFVLVAYGWQTVAQVWAVGIGVDGHRVLVHDRGRSGAARAPRAAARSRRAPGSSSSRSRTSRSGASRSTTSSCSAPSSRCRCGCRSYLINVYGVDIEPAGMIGRDVLVPGERVPRLWRPSRRTATARAA